MHQYWAFLTFLFHICIGDKIKLIYLAVDNGAISRSQAHLSRILTSSYAANLDLQIRCRQSIFNKELALAEQQVIKSHFDVKFCPNPPLVDRGIGELKPVDEYITCAIDSVLESIGQPIVLIMCSSSSCAQPHKGFELFMKHFATQSADIFLLDKTRSLTSFSDWHDLMLVSLSLGNPRVIDWLKTFQEVFLQHGDRAAFTLLAPRPALLESLLRHHGTVTVHHFSERDVCVSRGGAALGDANDAPPAGDTYSACGEEAVFVVECGPMSSNSEASTQGLTQHACEVTQAPPVWTHMGDPDIKERYIKGLDDAAGGQWTQEMLDKAVSRGVIIFRNATSPDMPRPFCWDAGCVILYCLACLTFHPK